MPGVPGDGTKRALNGLLFLGGTEIGYNLYGSVNSSPQTTQLRIAGKEGGGAAEATLMRWVWIANVKVVLLTGITALIARNVWPILGGLVAGGGMHVLYRLAVRWGKQDAPGPASPSAPAGNQSRAPSAADLGASRPDLSYIRP
jgi:hypothetical protein